jgi:hypothetical protein
MNRRGFLRLAGAMGAGVVLSDFARSARRAANKPNFIITSLGHE